MLMTVVYTHHKKMGEHLLGTSGIIFKGKSLNCFVNGHLVANISCMPGRWISFLSCYLIIPFLTKKSCFYLKKELFPPKLAHLSIIKTMLKSLYIYGVIISHPWGPHTNLMEGTIRTLVDVRSVPGKTKLQKCYQSSTSMTEFPCIISVRIHFSQHFTRLIWKCKHLTVLPFFFLVKSE